MVLPDFPQNKQDPNFSENITWCWVRFDYEEEKLSSGNFLGTTYRIIIYIES